MLRIPVDKVCVVVLMAREALGRLPSDDQDMLVDGGAEEGHARPSSEDYDGAAYDALFDYIDALNGDELADLLALVWLGRGDFDRADWADAQAEADDAVGDGDTVAEIIQDPTLPDDLTDGLQALGYECSED